MNKDGVLGMLTGVATAKAAASVMALGLDSRFDSRRRIGSSPASAGEIRPMYRSARPFGRTT